MDAENFINNTRLIAAFAVRREGKLDRVVIVAERKDPDVPDSHRYVWAEMASLDATYWHQGHYRKSVDVAMAQAMASAGWVPEAIGREHAAWRNAQGYEPY
jgi:hypothetical protein